MSLIDSIKGLFGSTKAALPTDFLGRFESFSASLQSVRDKATEFMARSDAQAAQIKALELRVASIEDQLGIKPPEPVADPDAPTELLPTELLPDSPSPSPTAGPVKPD